MLSVFPQPSTVHGKVLVKHSASVTGAQQVYNRWMIGR